MRLYAFTRRDRRTEIEREADNQADASRPPLDPQDRADRAHREHRPGARSFWCDLNWHADCGAHGELLSPCYCSCHG